ncbi:MAG TPA: class I SAM-dependent methyltransferase [Bacteroidota bacterium]|jgi:2-polyprenyl-3-methyl-5-hydroxy-6-metoxy-1,4-benzoquinol methylase|nr:class I SAM-dependent methyltransferase [Bacteroidota bacterium]
MEDFLYPHFYKVENEHWWFAARQRIIWEFMEKKLRLPAGTKLLDVGCGTGAILDMFSKKYNAYGQDIAPQAIEFCAQRGLTNLFCGTLDAFPKEYGTFDIITTLDVIEHIDNDAGALASMHALLNARGYLLIAVPAFPALWGTHDVVTHHKRRYVKKTLRAVVEQSGFQIEYMTYFNFFLFPVAYVRRTVARITGAAEASDMEIPSKPVNSILRGVFEFEKYLVPWLKFPFGLSLLCVARKV